ncbi:hypothetical protein Tco_0815300 [Tanacetum coccineum]
MSPRNLKRVLYSLTTLQKKRLTEMGFEEFEGNFDFHYVPGHMNMNEFKNVEQKEKKVPDDMVWDKTNAIVPFDDYHDKEYNDNVSVHNQDYDYDMEQSISSLAFKGSIIEAITEVRMQKKLFVVYISGDNEDFVSMDKSTWSESSGGVVIEVVHFVAHSGRKHRCISIFGIIDAVANDFDDLTVRYGEYAMVVVIPNILKMHWRTTYNGTDYGVFIMRHMETYVGHGIYLEELKIEGFD